MFSGLYQYHVAPDGMHWEHSITPMVSLFTQRFPDAQSESSQEETSDKANLRAILQYNYPIIFQCVKSYLSRINYSKLKEIKESVQFSSVTQLCPTLCNPMDCSTLGFPVHHQLPELTQTHVHRVSDIVQPSHPLLSLSHLTYNLSQ